MAIVCSSSTLSSCKITTPCSCRTYLIADPNHPADCGNPIVFVPTLKTPVCIHLFNALPTVIISVVRFPNRVLRVERGDGGRVVFVECLVKLRSQRMNLLGRFWIDRLFLLGKGWYGKTYCQCY